MGQKVHPTGIRLGISTDWNSKWYASSKEYPKFLMEDIKIRDYLETLLRVIIESLSHRRQPKTLRDRNQERFVILPV